MSRKKQILRALGKLLVTLPLLVITIPINAIGFTYTLVASEFRAGQNLCQQFGNWLMED